MVTTAMVRVRAIGYVRVSTTEQAEKGAGLEIQRRGIRAYCRAHRLELVDILGDEGISGSSGLEARPQLAVALTKIEDHEASVLVVFRLDRLARDLLLQETVVGRLRQFGGTVISVSEPDLDSDDPIRILVRQILGALSQYEKSLILGRMAAGRRAKAARGGFIGGNPRFGYEVHRGKLVPLESEQITITRMRVLRAQGATLKAIALTLDAEGLPPKRAAHWHPHPILRILNRD